MSAFFARNVHPVERFLRVALGVGVLSLVIIGPKSMWGLVGIVPLLTGLVGTCPVYSLLGINTCPVGKRTA
jgi:hypothetical protein